MPTSLLLARPKATVTGIAAHDAAAYIIKVIVRLRPGPPTSLIVQDGAHDVRELRDRVRAGIINSQLVWPEASISVYYPGSHRPSPAGLDLPIAVGILVASGQLPEAMLEGRAFYGQVGLDGRLLGTAHVAAAGAVSTEGVALVLPEADAKEAAAAGGDDAYCYGFASLSSLAAVVRGGTWPTVAEADEGGEWFGDLDPEIRANAR